MWREKPGTWTSAHGAPAGRDVSCATPKCVPRLSARHRSGTRTPVATYAQVTEKEKGYRKAVVISDKNSVGVTGYKGSGWGSTNLFWMCYQHVVLEGLACCTLSSSLMSGTRSHKETSQDRLDSHSAPPGRLQHTWTTFTQWSTAEVHPTLS